MTGIDKEKCEMNILVLNGSPRPQGNTWKMVTAFRESAEKAGHKVNVVNVCRKNIKGCLACEYCHGKGQGQCIQKDDMQEVYGYLRDANMLSRNKRIIGPTDPGLSTRARPYLFLPDDNTPEASRAHVRWVKKSADCPYRVF